MLLSELFRCVPTVRWREKVKKHLKCNYFLFLKWTIPRKVEMGMHVSRWHENFLCIITYALN